MALTGTVTQNISYGWYQSGNTTVVSAVASQTGTTGITESFSVPTSTTNQLLTIGFATADLKSVFMLATGTDVTLKANTTTATPITLYNGVPLVWQYGSGETQPFFAADVTRTYLTNASTTATAAVNIGIVLA